MTFSWLKYTIYKCTFRKITSSISLSLPNNFFHNLFYIQNIIHNECECTRRCANIQHMSEGSYSRRGQRHGGGFLKLSPAANKHELMCQELAWASVQLFLSVPLDDTIDLMLIKGKFKYRYQICYCLDMWHCDPQDLNKSVNHFFFIPHNVFHPSIHEDPYTIHQFVSVICSLEDNYPWTIHYNSEISDESIFPAWRGCCYQQIWICLELWLKSLQKINILESAGVETATMPLL